MKERFVIINRAKNSLITLFFPMLRRLKAERIGNDFYIKQTIDGKEVWTQIQFTVKNWQDDEDGVAFDIDRAKRLYEVKKEQREKRFRADDKEEME